MAESVCSPLDEGVPDPANLGTVEETTAWSEIVPPLRSANRALAMGLPGGWHASIMPGIQILNLVMRRTHEMPTTVFVDRHAPSEINQTQESPVHMQHPGS